MGGTGGYTLLGPDGEPFTSDVPGTLGGHRRGQRTPTVTEVAELVAKTSPDPLHDVAMRL